jgi:WD40 repeat protein
MGCLVSIENLNDPHNQKFLRGHDMPVCALAVSRTGKYIASGQLGTTHYKGNAAPILLWKADTSQRICVLRGLSIKVTMIAFSTDERFLCGCGEDCLMYIWDLTTGEVIYGQKTAFPISILTWAEHKKVSHNIEYDLVIGMNNTINSGSLTYDQMRMQWSLKWKAYTVPPMGGLIRNYYCIDLSNDRVFVYIGTSSGEMMVYRRDTLVFRACIPVCTNGLHDIVVLSDNSVVCGGGDGTFVKLIGNDMSWQKAYEVSPIRFVSFRFYLNSVLSVCFCFTL